MNAHIKKMEEKPVSENSHESSHENSPEKSKEAQPSTEKSPIENLKNELQEKENRYLYLYAEFENFKKRAAKERIDAVKFGWEPVARDLVATVDDLERVLVNIPSNYDKVVSDGLKMVVQNFLKTLEKRGVSVMNVEGKGFDPEFHEAIGQ